MVPLFWARKIGAGWRARTDPDHPGVPAISGDVVVWTDQHNDATTDSDIYGARLIGGFVTGGGWIDSPEGAYAPDPTLTGKATFSFFAKYRQGASTPTGKTQFKFRVADLKFHSDSYDWLVIAGSRAKYKGTGTINGAGSYGFMLSAIDAALTPSADVDLFRIRIWDKDNNDTVVYDNMMGAPDDADPTTEIGGGGIAIHKAN